MMTTNAYQQYANQAIQTASPEKLLLMLFEGAIKFARQARVAIQNKGIEDAHKNLIKVQDIISELMASLNMDYPISNNLMALYNYMKELLYQANLKKEVEPLDEVTSMLEELRDTFQQAALNAKQESQPRIVGGVNMEG